MKKRKLIFEIIAFISFVFSIGMLSACSSKNVTNIMFTTDNNVVTVGEFDLSNYKIKVDYKNGRSEEIEVNESMIDKNDLFKLYEVGTHDITFYYDNFYTTATFIVNVNHFDESIAFVTNGDYQGEAVFIQPYDGANHSLELTNNIPTNTQIVYPDGNSFREVKGTPYEVKAVLTKDGYEDKIVTGKMLIVVSEFPSELLEKIVFGDRTVTYDGTAKHIEATNLAPDLSVTYRMFDSDGKQVENAVEAGEYTVNAVFALNNYNYVLPEASKVRTAKLTVEKAPIDATSFALENVTKTYDGKAIAVKTSGTLPTDVDYEVVIRDSEGAIVTEPKNAGVYTAELVFSCDDDHVVICKSTTATLTINKRVVDLKGLAYDLEEVKYDGTIKRYSKLDGKLESFIQADFEYYKIGEDESCDPVEIGSYKVEISYSVVGDNDENYVFVNVPQNNAILIVK